MTCLVKDRLLVEMGLLFQICLRKHGSFLDKTISHSDDDENFRVEDVTEFLVFVFFILIEFQFHPIRQHLGIA